MLGALAELLDSKAVFLLCIMSQEDWGRAVEQMPDQLLVTTIRSGREAVLGK